MHTPSVALAWELWRKHQKRVLIMAGLFLGFALVYPTLCALVGINLNSPDALTEVVSKFAQIHDQSPSAPRIVQLVYVLFLTCGPMGAMFLTLLCVAWMFTFTSVDAKTKDPMMFPARLFTLPISTPFLFWWLLLAGQAAMVVFYWCWVHWVRLPHLDIFEPYQNCFAWMTLLALGQGIVWALAAWPFARMLLLMAALFCFSLCPARPDILNSPFVLPPLFILGVALAYIGLQKMRHGQWQGWNWERIFWEMTGRTGMRGPKRFASPGQAQLWFEWRRFVRILCVAVAALTVVPVVIHVLYRVVFGLGPIQNDTMFGICVELLLVPLLLHAGTGLSPARNDLPFVMLRPLTNGQILWATLKASAFSTVLSWLLVLAALCLMPLLGNFHAATKMLDNYPHCRALMLLGLMVLTWRLIPVNLCFVWSGHRRLAGVPVLIFIAGYVGMFVLALVSRNNEYWDFFWRLVPGLLTCLVALKFLLACAAFRLCLKRRLLAPSSLMGYLVIWALLVAALLIPTMILFHDQPWLFTASLVIILLTPLARIGLSPITLAWNRHA